MVRAILAIIGLASAEDPTRPHLAQAWTAQSVGDGMEGVVGQESYLVVGNEAHHLWDYGATGSKLWTCTNAADCTVYYEKLNGPNCCYCDQVDKPKVWDIDAKDTRFHKAAFVGFEDTTELNDNPVKGAEHWREDSKIFGVNVSYSYYLHREDNGDVISHRIDYGALADTKGSILYGNFQVAHDIDEHRKTFDVPEVCKGNILDCCDSMDEVDRKYDFHSYMIRKAQKAAEVADEPTQPHLAQAWTAMSAGDGMKGETGKESYFVSSDKKFKAHKYEYPEAGCTKISLHDPSQLHHIAGGERNYYLGCESVACCWSDFSMKEWDIQKPGMLTSVDFVGYEDTTELNDNPVKGAEHWEQRSKLPGNIGIGYEYYVHRTDDGDVISHRIDYNVTGADVPTGSILYGDFQVQHDLDAFKDVFTPPAECLKSNLLKCPSQQVDAWDQKHFKHDYALRMMQSELVV